MTSQVELAVRDFVVRLIKKNGDSISYACARDSSAEEFDLSPITTARYIKKLTSLTGILHEEGTGKNKVLRFKERAR